MPRVASIKVLMSFDVPQGNWVCDDDWRANFAQAMFFAGAIVGSLIFGFLVNMLVDTSLPPREERSFSRVSIPRAIKGQYTFLFLVTFLSHFLI